jgi:hypothetical protein
MNKLRIYIDTCIINRIVDTKHISEDEANAIDEITDFENTTFVTSKKAHQEIIKTSGIKRRSMLKLAYKLIDKIPTTSLFNAVPGGFGAVGFGESGFGGDAYETNIIFKQLNNIFDKDDADHIYQAHTSSCNYFLTSDVKTILKRLKDKECKIKEIIGNLKIVSPQELLKLLKKESTKNP